MTMTRERWAELDEFPDYAVSDQGLVMNMRTQYPIKVSMNQQGIAKVSMYKDRVLHTRAVPVLVAENFVEGRTEQFDTVIHLNGDRLDCRAENLAWRPRWFAIKFHRQFFIESFHNGNLEMVELKSGERYSSVKEACIRNGLHHFDVIKSCVEETFVFPTWQEFRAL